MASSITPWKPRPVDIEFVENLIRTIRPGGSWLIPMSQQVVRLDHDKKEAHLVVGKDNPLCQDISYKNRVIFRLLGWEFIDSRTTSNQ